MLSMYISVRTWPWTWCMVMRTCYNQGNDRKGKQFDGSAHNSLFLHVNLDQWAHQNSRRAKQEWENLKGGKERKVYRMKMHFQVYRLYGNLLVSVEAHRYVSIPLVSGRTEESKRGTRNFRKFGGSSWAGKIGRERKGWGCCLLYMSFLAVRNR